MTRRRGPPGTRLLPGARCVSRPGVPSAPRPPQFPGCLCVSVSFTRGCSLSLLGSFPLLRRPRERARACGRVCPRARVRFQRSRPRPPPPAPPPPSPRKGRSVPGPWRQARHCRATSRPGAARGGALQPAPPRPACPFALMTPWLAPQTAWLWEMWVLEGATGEEAPGAGIPPFAPSYFFAFWVIKKTIRGCRCLSRYYF